MLHHSRFEPASRSAFGVCILGPSASYFDVLGGTVGVARAKYLLLFNLVVLAVFGFPDRPDYLSPTPKGRSLGAKTGTSIHLNL